ncbi:hypothetical protein IH980_04525 [Patescibacteria group bacterium]|nr:hypothetical protein [Patescibacteria group bacterium]
MKLSSIATTLGTVVLHLMAIGVILAAFLPIAWWYFHYSPLWGVDFYYTASMTQMLKQSLAFPPAVWNHAWFSGFPFLSNFPILHYYFILLLTSFFDLFASIKYWMIISAALFFVGSYVLFYVLSKSHVLSAILSVAAVYSIGVYGSLMWGGSLPSFATQAFFPWALVFVALHLRTKKRRFLFAASLIAGLAIWGHPQVVIAYIFPAAAIIYALSFGRGTLVWRAMSFLGFLALTILVGFPLVYRNFSALTLLYVPGAYEVGASTVKVPSDLSGEVIEFIRRQPLRAITDTQPLIFILFGLVGAIYLSGLSFKSTRLSVRRVLPFVAVFLWFAFYIWLFSRGISMFHGGWYRLFWSVPIFVGMLTSIWWGSVRGVIQWPLAVTFEVIFLVLALGFLLRPYGGSVRELTRPDVMAALIYPETFGENYYFEGEEEVIAPGTLSLLLTRSQPSSAFPDLPSMKTDPSELAELRSRMVPEWLDPQETDYRLYDADQTVNIWWSTLYPMPLARGYLDPPTSGQKGYTFWLDASLNQDVEGGGKHQLVGTFDYPEDIAKDNTLFLIDWYGIKYFEAGHAGPFVYSPLPQFLVTDEYMAKEEVLDFNEEKFSTGNQELHYYELKDEYVSPILMATNASTVGIVASDQGYETIVRALADANLGVQKLIPIKLGRALDKLRFADISSMDALILYDYKYVRGDKAFRLLEEYIRRGGKAFIDSGIETKESDHSGALPAIFPIERSERTPLGGEWDLEVFKSPLTTGVSFERFDPPLFDELNWNFSYPPRADDVRSQVEILIKNHGRPILATHEIGEGQVVWSGMNLPYHVIRFHNPDEVTFFTNIMEDLVDTQQDQPVFEATSFSPQEREITATGARGVLLKEQAYPGWKAEIQVNGERQGARIFKAGPAVPGFMYVRLPEASSERETVVRFRFRGSLVGWVTTVITLTIVLIFSERAIFDGRLFGRRLGFIEKKIRTYLMGWWEKEDE